MRGAADVAMLQAENIHTQDARESAQKGETAKVAKEFEAIFLRKMLASMEKTTTLTGHSAGASMYGQMVTDALADAMGRGGGIGLADAVEKYMESSSKK